MSKKVVITRSDTGQRVFIYFFQHFTISFFRFNASGGKPRLIGDNCPFKVIHPAIPDRYGKLVYRIFLHVPQIDTRRFHLQNRTDRRMYPYPFNITCELSCGGINTSLADRFSYQHASSLKPSHRSLFGHPFNRFRYIVFRIITVLSYCTEMDLLSHVKTNSFGFQMDFYKFCRRGNILSAYDTWCQAELNEEVYTQEVNNEGISIHESWPLAKSVNSGLLCRK